MTNQIAQFFDVDENSPETRPAVDQVSIDRDFLGDLVALRHRDAPDAEKFAATIGVELDELLYFESDPLDSDLGFIRLYALALGALLTHQVKSAGELADLRYFDAVPRGVPVKWVSSSQLANARYLGQHDSLI